MTKRGLRDIDVRGAVGSLVVDGARVEVVVRSMIPTVRPDDVVGALRKFGAEVPGAAISTRVEQGPLVDGVVVDPLV